MHDAGQPSEQRQQYVEPEMQSQAYLEKHAERRQQESEKNSNDIQALRPPLNNDY
jgi:hypothetical protein